jgi:hypothetical protein
MNSVQLLIAQLVRKFSAFYGTKRFITWLITAHVWILLELEESIPQPPSIFEIHFNIILPSKPSSCKGYLLISISNHKKFVHIPHLFQACCMFFLFNPLSLDW